MSMEKDDYREDRIVMRAVVDAYDSEERAISWYYYLENELAFPFQAQCFRRLATSPLKVDDPHQVVGMADVDDCRYDMFVMIDFGEDQLAVPLSQLELVGEVHDDTSEAILDWHYWVEQGYQF